MKVIALNGKSLAALMLLAALDAEARAAEANSRRVADHQSADGKLHISTMRIASEFTGDREMYHTGIAHTEFPCTDDYVIVGEYHTKEAALAGHNYWKQRFTDGTSLPLFLIDRSSIAPRKEGNAVYRVTTAHPSDDFADEEDTNPGITWCSK